MTAAEFWGLLGVFVGGALPWLEAVIVIPAGIIAGLSPVLVVIFGTVGNLLTVGVSAWFGAEIRDWFRRRRRDREVRKNGVDFAEWKAEKRERREQKIKRVMARGGMPLLALLGPIGLGTQFTAVAAVAMGVSPTRSFVWVGAGTVLWTIVAAAATLAGFEIFGIGG